MVPTPKHQTPRNAYEYQKRLTNCCILYIKLPHELDFKPCHQARHMECSNLGFQLWAVAIFLFATNLKGISSMKLHRDLGVTRKNAWFLAHRIRETWQDTSAWLPGFHPFDGPIEADETYVGGKRKNMSHEKRKEIRGRGTVGKVVVAGVKDRATGQVSARVVQGTDSVTPQGCVRHHATPSTPMQLLPIVA